MTYWWRYGGRLAPFVLREYELIRTASRIAVSDTQTRGMNYAGTGVFSKSGILKLRYRLFHCNQIALHLGLTHKR